jgi:putative sigma-54 modulation protein
MQIAVSFRHLDTSPALRDYASEKLEHTVGKYIQAPIDAKVILSVERYWHIASFTLRVHGLMIKSEDRSEDMYSSIDLAMGKLEQQLRRYKDRIRDHKPADGGGKRFSIHTIEAPSATVGGFTEDELEDVAEEFRVPAQETGPEAYGYIDVTVESHRAADGHGHVKVLRRADIAAQPMNVSDAIMQLDLTDQSFYVFTDSESGKMQVVYRRDDGNYGLLETQPD